VVFTSTTAGSTPEAIALASAGPPVAVEFELPELPEPPGPKEKPPEPKGEVPEPEEGNVVGVVPPLVLVRHAARPTPNPAAMAIKIASTRAVSVYPQCLLGCDADEATQ
jgi:hypothetical protein